MTIKKTTLKKLKNMVFPWLKANAQGLLDINTSSNELGWIDLTGVDLNKADFRSVDPAQLIPRVKEEQDD